MSINIGFETDEWWFWAVYVLCMHIAITKSLMGISELFGLYRSNLCLGGDFNVLRGILEKLGS